MTRQAQLILAFSLAVASGCGISTAASGQEDILILEVARELVPCVGEMVGQCIQVRSSDEEDWRKFYNPIEGFEHEAGVRYTVEVARRDVLNPPADGSAFAYRLLRILARDPAEGA